MQKDSLEESIDGQPLWIHIQFNAEFTRTRQSISTHQEQERDRLVLMG